METLTSHSNDPLLKRLLERITDLEAALKQRDAIIVEQAEALKRANQESTQLKEEIARLQNGGHKKPSASPPPDWVKPNTKSNNTTNAPEGGKPKRKKRTHNFTFHRKEPTEFVPHACDNCPDCGQKLSDGWEYSRRQILEIPEIALRVIDHIVTARYCGVCQKVCVPEVDYSQECIGRGHYGLSLVSLIAYLRVMCRLPKAVIAGLLQALLGLSLSVGEISELLHRVATQGKDDYVALQTQVKSSAFVHADETGWREDGQNGYIWSFSTPFVRYYTYHHSRAHTVPEEVLGTDYAGIVVSDFYGGYNSHLGLHQRCWVHLLRDLHDLKEKHPLPGVLDWAKKLRDLYDRAKAFTREDAKERCAARLWFQADLLELALPYVNACLPQSVLAKRLVAFEAELFTFVEYPQVPSENNAAERSVRPRVVARKISGGTRSSAGSKTMVVLASLFETWCLRGADCLASCRAMLIASQKPKAAPASECAV